MTQQEIDRKRQMAQMLLQARAPQMGQAGRFHVAPSAFAQIAPAIQQVTGGIMGKQADKGQQQLDDETKAKLAQSLMALTGVNGPGADVSPEKMAAVGALTQAPIAQQQQAVGQLSAQALAPPKQANDRMVEVMGENGPVFMPESQAAGMTPYTSARQDQIPMTVREWEYFSALPEEQKTSYLTMKRADKYSDLGGGRQGRIDPLSGTAGDGVVDKDTFNQNVEDKNRSAAQGTAQGSAMTAAQEQLAGLETQEQVLLGIMNDENFEGAVGPLDALTGRIGEKFGSDEGVLGGQVERAANQLVTQAVSSWKGAISERELDFFLKSVPGRGNSPATWRKWYQDEYLPRKQLADRIASGDAFSPTAAPAATTSTGITWSIEED